jgi:hypothetical protein
VACDTITNAAAGPHICTDPHSVSGMAGDRVVTTILRTEDY